MNKLQTIREKCIAANPDAEWQSALNSPTLATVLFAIEMNKKWPPYRIGTHGLFFVAKEVSSTPMYISTGISWNLFKDDLTLQSEETIDFIYELLK